MFEQSAAEQLIKMALAEDLGERGDITSLATIPANIRLCGHLRAKAVGVLAGLPLVEMVYRQVDPNVTVSFYAQDGERVAAGTVAAEVTGPGRSVLTGERVALNFVQRLSGIATLTARFVAAVEGTQAVILDTRKTTPGWRSLEKYAVRMGGGRNHRIGLYDMVLVKDNHIDGAGGITPAVNAARAYLPAHNTPIEVEVRTLEELREALSLGVDRILLDNMDEEQMRAAVQLAAGRVPLEASGNMSLERARAVAETGVDFISVGALTHSAPALDLSMKITRV
ncbi:MAG: carboxylating nicotinate-nucleotide diphosphorylase [Chloroflexi bacterium]|nr:carboxylating nicotinate-nucleotide diphosphorylase [Chloroflexota bacterium]MDL1883233.1 carboxylating nicotinate-nucleotide diphosphorylase [Anaerolineae bacterium CFX8]